MTDKFVTARRRLALGVVSLTLALGLAVAPVRAQDAVAAQGQTKAQTQTQHKLPEGQIEQLVSPIALYPDPLLTQVLMASTYPLEVVEAARWSQANPTVRGTALEDAMQAQSWDPSVKALAALPQTLQMMNDKLDWTEQLGDAFLAQQQDLLDAVQKLRAEAQAAGNLQSTPHQVVTTMSAPAGSTAFSPQQAIVIEPASPDSYYVPVYNPAVVFGAWAYPEYPPFYWYPPGFVASNAVSFAAGVAVGAAIWGGCDWWNHNVIINVNRFNTFNRTNLDFANNVWAHSPAHRGDIPYRNAAVASRFGRPDFTTENTNALRDEIMDRLGAQHPAEPGLTDVDRDLRNDVAPRREAEIERDIPRDLGERQARNEALSHLDRPRIDDGARIMHWRPIDFHKFGGFRGLHRL